MFDHSFSPVRCVVGVHGVLSARDGWHARTGLATDASRFARLDVRALSSEDAMAVLVALQEVRAEIDVLEADLLTRAAGAEAVSRDVLVDGRTMTFTDEVVDEIAAGLRRSCDAVARQVQVARLLQGPLTRTRSALADGRISMDRARMIAEQAARMAPPVGSGEDAQEARFTEACDQLQDRVLPHAPSETMSEVRSRARRAVAVIDKAAEAQRRRRARRGCDVRGYGIDDGLAVIEARVPALDAASVLARLDAAVRAVIADGTADDPDWRERHGLACDPTLGQIRAAVYLDLLRQGGGSTERSISVEVQVVVDAATLAGLDPDGSAWVKAGSGEPVAVGRSDLISLFTDPACHVQLRRLVTDPATGALVDRGSRTYAVSEALAAWITARDRTCRFPGCTRRAEICDCDHACDYRDGGLTTVANTGAMCRRHHNRKTHAQWRVVDSRPDGSCVFISPRGFRYVHFPVEVLPLPPPPF